MALFFQVNNHKNIWLWFQEDRIGLIFLYMLPVTIIPNCMVDFQLILRPGRILNYLLQGFRKGYNSVVSLFDSRGPPCVAFCGLHVLRPSLFRWQYPLLIKSKILLAFYDLRMAMDDQMSHNDEINRKIAKFHKFRTIRLESSGNIWALILQCYHV